jgi:hypothetical protein
VSRHIYSPRGKKPAPDISHSHIPPPPTPSHRGAAGRKVALRSRVCRCKNRGGRRARCQCLPHTRLAFKSHSSPPQISALLTTAPHSPRRPAPGGRSRRSPEQDRRVDGRTDGRQAGGRAGAALSVSICWWETGCVG